jgi:transcriptional regulator with XRE-family HTH domain
MTLDAYLRKHGLTSAQFAKATGALTKQTVHNYRHGIRFPSPESQRLIEEKTGGEVTPKDFVQQHAGPSEISSAPANDEPTKPKGKRTSYRANDPPKPGGKRSRASNAANTPTSSSAKAA